MPERREHWDDDLLHALDVALGPHDLTRDQRYDVLAAVEDWQRQKLRSDGSQCARAGEPLCECCYDVRELSARIRVTDADG